MAKRRKIAVIGTGIAGNVVSYYLNQDHDITVFEKNSYVGGHSHTHSVSSLEGNYQVDSGFIVFNYETYPQFTRLLKNLGVQVQTSKMSFGVRCERTGLEYMGSTLNSLFTQRRNLFRPSFWGMLIDIVRFNRNGAALLDKGDTEISLEDYLKKEAYGEAFKEDYLLPMASAVWSADKKMMSRFPAKYLIRFFYNHGLLKILNRPQWYVIKGGSKAYVDAITKGYRQAIRLDTAVNSISRSDTGVIVKTSVDEESFDDVFIACHSDQALSLLANPKKLEREVLGAITYQENDAVLHTDTSLLPKNRRAWAAWNYHRLEREQDQVAMTYNMNILQNFSCETQFCVTLNNTSAVDPSKIIARMTYEHPVYTPESVAAQGRHKEINGQDRIYFCGAYWRYGFHEDGVVSAMSALDDFYKRK
tara:strand:- start:12434 stop:13687 length:1254 start_codon:yes stop_codon:yes gene_type:complete